MAKPIAVLYLPSGFSFTKDGRAAHATSLMMELSGFDDRITTPYSGYMWFVFQDGDIRTPRLEVFNADKMEPADIEELQKRVIGYMKEKEVKDEA